MKGYTSLWEALPFCERPCLSVKGPASLWEALPLCERPCLSLRGPVSLWEALHLSKRPCLSVAFKGRILKWTLKFALLGLLLQIHSPQMDFWVHSANITGYCLWIDTPHAYVWATWNFHFLMGGPRFEVNLPPSKILWKPFLAKYPISIHKMAAKMLVGFLKLFFLHSWHASTQYCTLLHFTALPFALLQCISMYFTVLYYVLDWLWHCTVLD